MFKSINKVVKAIIYWDVFINSAFGILNPVFAIFIIQKITLGSAAKGAEVVGLATLIYWVVKSFLQLPIGKYLDKNHGEKDDFWFMIIGTLLTGFVPFGYLFSIQPWHIYTLQLLQAVGMSMVIPSSYAIFTRHIDKGKEAFEWSLDSTLLGVGVGIAGAVGGFIATTLNFQMIFILAGIFTLFSAALLLLIKEDMSTVSHFIHKIPPSRPI